MRKYLPTLGELIDRLTIVQLKEVKIPKHKEEYQKEIEEIVHDITEILTTVKQLKVDGDFIRAVIGNNLLLTHGLNGIRNTAKNKIQELDGGRKDYKVDCIASDFKDWEISW